MVYSLNEFYLPVPCYSRKKDFPGVNFMTSFPANTHRKSYFKIPKSTFKTRSTRSCHRTVDFDPTKTDRQIERQTDRQTDRQAMMMMTMTMMMMMMMMMMAMIHLTDILYILFLAPSFNYAPFLISPIFECKFIKLPLQ